MFRHIDIVAEPKDNQRYMGPYHPLMSRSTPATQRDLHWLTKKEQLLPQTDRKKPAKKPESAWDEHDKAAWVELPPRPKMHIQAPKVRELLHHLFFALSHSLSCFPGPFEKGHATEALQNEQANEETPMTADSFNQARKHDLFNSFI